MPLDWAVIAAPVLAAIVSLSGLLSAHRRRLSWRAGFYVLARLSVDAISGLLAALLITNAYPNVEVLQDPAMQALISGLAGPAFLRSQINLVGRRLGGRTIGPAALFGQFMAWIDDSIDQISAVEQSRWMASEVIPGISRQTCKEIADSAEVYLRGLERLDKRRRDTSLKYIADTLKAADDDRDIKSKKAIVQHMLDNNGRRFVKTLVASERDRPKGSGVVRNRER